MHVCVCGLGTEKSARQMLARMREKINTNNIFLKDMHT
jgi:hypothetical protein